jgi:Flp pilus assembly protein TadB
LDGEVGESVNRKKLYTFSLTAEIALVVLALFLPGPEKWVLIGLSLIGIAIYAHELRHARKTNESDDSPS